MKFFIALCVIFVMACATPGFAQTNIIDDFERGIFGWESILHYGDVTEMNCRSGPNEGSNGTPALHIDCIMKANGLNHIVYYKNVNLDLSMAGGVQWNVKAGHLPQTRLLGYLADSEGKYAFYPLQEYKGDNDQWMPLKVMFQKDQALEGGQLNLKKITRVGFMIQAFVPVHDALLVDDIRILPSDTAIRVEPGIITPNGDGILDFAAVQVFAPKGAAVTVYIKDASGTVIETLADQKPATGTVMDFQWKALRDGKPVAAGEYQVAARWNDTTATLPVTVRHREAWKPFQNQKQEHHPIGVWFEGSPVHTHSPEDPVEAAKYYESRFKDIAEMGFNTVVISWLPDSLWPVVFAAARAHDLKVILHIGSVYGVIRSNEPFDEDRLERILLDVKERTKNYPGVVVRFMAFDEPTADDMPRWLLVHRIINSIFPEQPGMSVLCTAVSMKTMVENIRVDEAVFDAYPQVKGLSAPSEGMFMEKLRGYRQEAGKLPLWAVLQTFASDVSGWRYPTPAELQFNTYQALAAGSRGTIYFLYNSCPGYGEKLQGLVDENGVHQQLAATASRLAKELGKVLPALAKFPADSFTYQQRPDVCIGQYSRGDGKQALVIANRDMTKAFASKVLLKNAEGWYVDLLSNQKYMIQMNQVDLKLPPAGAVILVQVP